MLTTTISIDFGARAMITGIHHINFLVKHLDENTRYLERLLDQRAHIDALPDRGVTTARFTLDHAHIVLVCPTSEEGEPARILRERGEGLFLLSLAANSIDETLDYLESQAITPSSPRRDGLLNWSVIDLAAPSGLGPVLQICEEKH